MTTLLLRRFVFLFCAIVSMAFLASCDAPADQATPEQGEETPAASELQSFSSYDEQARALLAEMTLAEKVGQMTQAEQSAMQDPTDVATLFLGSVLSGGGSDPAAGNSLEAWTAVYDSLQQQALTTRLGIPILYGIDAVHGHNNVLGAVVFPHNIGLGATRNPELVEAVSRATAAEVRATGINWTFSPCVTVPRDERWGRTYEGFAEDPELVSVLGEAAVRGYQGASLDNPLSVLACAKHYLGDGGTAFGTGSFPNAPLDQGDTQVDEETLRRIHLTPYLPAIEAGVGSIMPSYSSWNGEKVSGSEYLLTEVLKEELGFEGFLISDYNAIDQVYPDDYKTAIAMSVNAGMDMAMVPTKYREFIQHLTDLVNEGEVPMERIDDAVLRILRVKIAMGLMEEGRSHLADQSLQQSFGSDEHREIAREAVRQSLVLLKNEGETLPLSKEAVRIHVAGKNADDIGNQSGGWTIDWQGQSGEVTPGGTTILEAIRNTVSDSTEVTFALDGTGADGADVGIVVIGETPYAEGVGDRADLALGEEDIAAVRTMKEAGVPVVVVLISGRPMIINDVLDQADAFIAAWLPGTEGQGVADVLFGDYAPTGKLPLTWPRSADQLPINVGDEAYDPLFEYGYGLTY
ncbi:MAG TPA: glycoside hydrolase family 3 N-terminal domain-containing protein [Rhodothermales bacterium]|nr:glycoside hydrolase family 3 N-terminal domain-containing protein [Rhodothermales bacterium]